MEGEVLLIGEQHKVMAKKLFSFMLSDRFYKRRPVNDKMLSDGIKNILQDNSMTFVVALAGGSGAGKTVVSHELAAFLRSNGIVAKCVSADNFYKIPPNNRKAWREAHPEQIGSNEYDWALMNRVIADFRARRKSYFPTIDLNTQEVDELITDFSKVRVLIIDGLFAISTRLSDCDYRAFLTVSAEKMASAQVLRGKENAADPFRAIVMAKEAKDVLEVVKENKEVIYIDCDAYKISWMSGADAVKEAK